MATIHTIFLYNEAISHAEVVYHLKHPVDFSEPIYYEFRVSGRLSQAGASWFEGMTLSVDEGTTPPQTIISGYVLDRAALHGLINRIRDIGLTLVSVQRLEGKPGTGQQTKQDQGGKDRD
jgi:hypothetical protein